MAAPVETGIPYIMRFSKVLITLSLSVLRCSVWCSEHGMTPPRKQKQPTVALSLPAPFLSSCLEIPSPTQATYDPENPFPSAAPNKVLTLPPVTARAGHLAMNSTFTTSANLCQSVLGLECSPGSMQQSPLLSNSTLGAT